MEFQSLYHSPNMVKVITSRIWRWADRVARMEEGRSAFKIVTSTPTEKRHLGKPRRRWEDNIRMGHKEICIRRNWAGSNKELLESPCELDLRVP